MLRATGSAATTASRRAPGSAVRWWSAWQRAENWLARVAGDLQWLDHDGAVTLRVRP